MAGGGSVPGVELVSRGSWAPWSGGQVVVDRLLAEHFDIISKCIFDKLIALFTTFHNVKLRPVLVHDTGNIAKQMQLLFTFPLLCASFRPSCSA